MNLTDVGDALLVLCALAALTFAVLYGTRSRWSLLVAGRSLLYVIAALSLVLVQNAAGAYFGLAYPGRDLIRLALYGGLLLTLANMVRTLLAIQRGKRAGVLPDRDLTDSREGSP